MLNDDILLEIFNQYRLEDEESWNHQLGWCKLSHVCRNWRHLIHEFSVHLDMHIVLTNSKLPLDTLAHLPFLPLVIDYRSGDPANDSGILHAIQQRDRIRRIVLQVPPPTLHKLVVTMDELFPRLDTLSLLSATEPEDGSRLILPRTFLAPDLRHLELSSICLPAGLQLLSSTVSLTILKLTGIHARGYFTPEYLVTQIQHIPQLEELSIGFSIPIPRPRDEGSLLRAPIMPTTLPALRWLKFRGVAAYLENLVARIRAPLLERFNVTLFNQLIFTLPHLFQFISTTEGFRHPIASVIFNRDAVSFVVGPRDQFSDGIFSLRINSKQLDWQIDSTIQLCGVLAPLLSVAEELMFVVDERSLPEDWQDAVDDIAVWHGILRPFDGVKKLRIGHPLALELSNALESDNVELVAVLLPELHELRARVEIGHARNAFAAFIDTRRRAGCPILLSVLPVTSAPTPKPLSPKPLSPKPLSPKPPSLVADEHSSTVTIESLTVTTQEPFLSDVSLVRRNWFRRAVVDRVRKRLGPRVPSDS